MGVEGDGTGLGAMHWGEDTAATARRTVIKPFLDARLKGDAPAPPLPAVISYPSMGEAWRRSNVIPVPSKALYLQPGGRLSFDPPVAGAGDHDSFTADPLKPVPASARPFLFGHDGPWPTSLVEDQRFAAARPDVLTYVTDPLTAPLHLFGQAAAEIAFATTGTDADVVVKLIDVFPDDERDRSLRGYQLPVAMEIVRARYRDSLDRAKPMTPGQLTQIACDLPLADHVFRPGHRLMVQVQSSFFPLYDRNPQTFVPNIFNAMPSDYHNAEQSVFHAPGRASLIRLPIAAE